MCEIDDVAADNGLENRSRLPNFNKNQPKPPSSPKKLHTCSICNESFRQKIRLKDHITKNHWSNGSFICKVCGNRLTSFLSLENHTRLHTGEKPFSCDHCEKSFTQYANLYTHRKKFHRGPRPHVCKECGACFTLLQQLKSHESTHIIEKTYTYACDVCDKSFVRSTSLAAHKKLIHEGYLPYM